ncbi:MAG: T9SS type A sorting domain-containing protein [Candidatus Marinimicrobia bacterium]|nr:T9SS type A sorting domain-containing protein [Candidatus Neomarinimicrobiota bacterium]
MTYEENAFDPATDSLFFMWQDAWGAELQGVGTNTVPSTLRQTYLYRSTEHSRTLGENVQSVTIPIVGPAPHAMMYTTKYVKADGTEVSELGSGYGFGRYRTQWLKPETVGGSIALVQGLELVKFSNLGTPLEVMPEPFANDLTFVLPVSTEVDNLPTTFALSQNYPNPFNPTTTISYVLPEAVDVDLIVFDITGREVTRLIDNRSHNAGRYDIMWNGLNADGKRVASGLYIYKIMAGDFQQTHKMLLLK